MADILADQRKIRNRDEGSHADIGHVTKTAISANSRWRTAAILKIAVSPYLSREFTDFDQIWYTDTNFHPEHGNLTKKSKIVLGQYLSAILANLCKFRNGDEESQAYTGHLTKVAIFANSRWRTAAILKIALYPYHISVGIIRFRANLVCRCKFPFRDGYLPKKIEIFQIQDGGRTPY